MSNYKVGDKVKIIGNSNFHSFALGTVVTLKRDYNWQGTWTETQYDGAPYNIMEVDFVLFEHTPGKDCIF